MKGTVKESVVQKGNAEELNKIVKDGVMNKNAGFDDMNVCNSQYVWETMVTNPKNKAKNMLV